MLKIKVVFIFIKRKEHNNIRGDEGKDGSNLS